MRCLGFEIVCPDGLSRHYPYHNEGDARCDATGASKDPAELLGTLEAERAWVKREWAKAKQCKPKVARRLHEHQAACGRDAIKRLLKLGAGEIPVCQFFLEPSDIERALPRCPGGQHTVRPVTFEHDVSPEDMH
jgi:hypothetical protein